MTLAHTHTLLLLLRWQTWMIRGHCTLRRQLTSADTCMFRCCSRYEPEFYYWETVEMTRRFVLVGVLVLVLRGSIMQLIIGSVFALVHMFFQMQAAPYADSGDDFIANASSFGLAVVFLCSNIRARSL